MSENSFQIKVKSIDNSQIELTVNATTLVSEVKSLILAQVQVPIDRQRLLFKGKLLRNTQALGFYNIIPQSIVQLIAYLERPPEEDSISDLIRYTLDSIPNTYISNRRIREQRRREIDLSERMESIRQNLQTLENLINTNRYFKKGQWIDVKDTVDQWLEAQIIDINITEVGTQLFVHYNGWPSRWDEWIDSESPRIQYFKIKTYQSLASPMHSPYPVTSIDAEGFRNNSAFDINECLLQTLSVLDQIQVMFNTYNTISNEDSENSRRLGSVLAPVIDRFGRLMSDIAGIIGNHQRANDDAGSVTSSLITNESGNSIASGVRPPMQIPIMPPPSELALSAPRIGSDFDIHIHAFFAQRNLDQEPRAHCWDNFT